MNTAFGKAMLGAVLTAAAFSAHATTYNINNTLALDLSSGSANFGDTFGLGTTGKTFQDLFTFTVGGASSADASLTSLATKTTADLNITGFNLLKNGVLYQAGTQVLKGALDVWTLDSVALAAGSYAVQVTGQVLGTKGGSFGAQANVSPVPEPATWAMMIGGIALVAGLSRRRAQGSTPLAGAAA